MNYIISIFPCTRYSMVSKTAKLSVAINQAKTKYKATPTVRLKRVIAGLEAANKAHYDNLFKIIRRSEHQSQDGKKETFK